MVVGMSDTSVVENPLLLLVDEPRYLGPEDYVPSNIFAIFSKLANWNIPGRAFNSEEARRFIPLDNHRKLIIVLPDTNISVRNENEGEVAERFIEFIENWQELVEELNEAKQFQVDVFWVAAVSRIGRFLRDLNWYAARAPRPIHILRLDPDGNGNGPGRADAASVADNLGKFLAA